MTVTATTTRNITLTMDEETADLLRQSIESTTGRGLGQVRAALDAALLPGFSPIRPPVYRGTGANVGVPDRLSPAPGTPVTNTRPYLVGRDNGGSTIND